MSNHPEALRIIDSFVRSDLTPAEFAQHLYHTPELELILSEEDAPRYCHSGTTLFHHLISLDFNDVADAANVQSLLSQLLKKSGISVTPSDDLCRDLSLLYAAQPKWLDADSKYLTSLLASISVSDPKERKAILRKRILELFRYVKRPPRWLQSPAWPITDSRPMVFLGQLSIEDYFHDTACVYVFHDPDTGESKSIIQVA